jgi:hypothetical protein
MIEADTQAYQQERFRLFRAQIEADLGITSEIERIRGAYTSRSSRSSPRRGAPNWRL